MNIDIANRLYEYRKANNLSQEELAERIGVSRQAVSKWERAEASPDTDNLILLARLYNVSLDELLQTEGPIGKGAGEEKAEEKLKEKVHVGWDGIHVVDEDSEVHIDKHGVFVKEKDEVKCDTANGMKGFKGKRKKDFWDIFPFFALVTAGYFCLGVFAELWHPGWLIFLAIPIWYCMIDACREFTWRRFFNRLPVPIIVTAAFLSIGFLKGIWNPTWALFLIIPVYYPVVNAIFEGIEHSKNKEEPPEDEDIPA